MTDDPQTAPSGPPDPPELEVAQRLGRQMKQLHKYVSGQMMKAMQEQLQGDDITFSQMTALHQLRAHAPVSVGGLAELTGLSLPAASHLTDRLVQRGYAERRENPEDRRAKLLALTPGGEEILNSMDLRFNETYQMVFGRVSSRAISAAADSLQVVFEELQAQDREDGRLLPGCIAGSLVGQESTQDRPPPSAPPAPSMEDPA